MLGNQATSGIISKTNVGFGHFKEALKVLSDSLMAPKHGQKNKLRHQHVDVMKHEVTESNHSGVCLCASLSSGLIVFAEVLRP